MAGDLDTTAGGQLGPAKLDLHLLNTSALG